jgi:hypothetical protein
MKLLGITAVFAGSITPGTVLLTLSRKDPIADYSIKKPLFVLTE